MTRALTLHQPWASLVAVGAKTIETRSWSTSYRGPMVIHAAKRAPETEDIEQDHAFGTIYNADASWSMQWARHVRGLNDWHYYIEGDGPHPLPLGAVVASCRLVDCVPIVDRFSWVELQRLGAFVSPASGGLLTLNRWGDPATYEKVDDQLPFGDFTPGRWAWLLEDVKPTTERCPRCWGLGGESDHARCAPNAACQVPRYLETDGLPIRHNVNYVPKHAVCFVCEGEGAGAPVPMRGRQGLFTPEWPA